MDPRIPGEDHEASGGRQEPDPPASKADSSAHEADKIPVEPQQKVRLSGSGLSVMLYNARTLFEESKRHLLDSMISDVEADVIMITETRFNHTIPDGAVSFAGYDVACRVDRKARFPGGGAMILTKSGVKYHNAKVKCVNFGCQVASIQVVDTVILLVYRRPQCTRNQDEERTTYLVNEYGNQKIVIAKDFNLPTLQFDRLATYEINAGEKRSIHEMWKDTIRELQLEQMINQPTHNLGNVLDYVFHRESEATILEPPIVHPDLFVGFSDHYPIIFKVNILPSMKKDRNFIFDMNKMNFETYRHFLENCDLLARKTAAITADEKWRILRNAILMARQVSCPVIEIKDTSRPKWSNQKIKDTKLKITRIRSKLKSKSGTLAVIKAREEKLVQLNKDLKLQVNLARTVFDNKIVDKIEDDGNYLFKHVKGVKRGNSNSPPINGIRGQPLANDQSKANEFQAKFMSVFGNDTNFPRAWREDTILTSVDLDPQRVRKKVFDMNPNAAPGLDTIGMKLYREAPYDVFIALSMIFHRCFNFGELPHDWSLAKVIPLWKNAGSKFDIDKYRPVSLCISAMKIMEAMFLEDIVELAEVFDCFGEEQHGFRSGRSTITNLTQYWDRITSMVDKDKRVYVLNLDMSKAFDCLKIDYILDSLDEIGVGGQLGRFIQLWLRNRYQCVEVAGKKSNIEKITSGVQQGSLNGPVLYNLAAARVTSDLRGRENIKFYQYADDLKLIFEVKNEEDAASIQSAAETLVAVQTRRSSLLTHRNRL